MSFFSKIKSGLQKTKDSFVKQMDLIINSFTKIDDEFLEELEEQLIMADVGVKTSEKICEKLREKIKQTGITDPAKVKGLLKEIVCELLKADNSLNLSAKPSVVLVIGVNGVGKTTSIGKLATSIKSQGKTVLLAAADTFRAAAIDQLEIWANRSGCDIVKHAEGADPAAVVFDAISAAKARGTDVVICDTAGRLHNKKNLMDELSKIRRIINKEINETNVETLLVLDATTGQNGVNQAKEFLNATGLTGIILTKLDGTAKGGVVVSIKEELSIPIKYIGTGEQMDDLQPFEAEDFANALFE
jgi:fused signal recognition particle receptor